MNVVVSRKERDGSNEGGFTMKQRSRGKRIYLELETLEDRLCLTTVASGSPVPIPLPVVHAGDTVMVTATLNVNDSAHTAFESGEGEPLIIQSAGGFSAVVSSYAQPQTFSFTATAADESAQSLSAYIQDYDADESANVTVMVNPKQWFTADEKKFFAQASSIIGGIAGGAGVVAAAAAASPDPIVSKEVAAVFGIAGGVAWIESEIFSFLSTEPADPNYTVIAQPNPPALAPLTVQPGVTLALANAFNAFLANGEQVIGVGNALITSLNRADGALQAGSGFWETQQVQAASRYSSQLASLLNAQPSLLLAFQNAYAASGLPTITITPNDVLNYEVSVGNNGLPASLVQTLTQLGADSTTIATVRTLSEVQDPNAIAGTYPANLTNPIFISGLQGAASALAALGPVQQGQTAGIGFWHNKNGQALIESFNGGPNSTALATWLATNFPNLYGANAGANNLTGDTNTQVAAFYQSLFREQGPKLDAEVLDTALDVYATTLSLGGMAAQPYGFTVTAFGLGASFYNVGASGTAFGEVDDSLVNIFALLRDVNKSTVNGVIFNGDPTLRDLANTLFDNLNQSGSMG